MFNKIIPLTTILTCVVIVWVIGAIFMNKPILVDKYERNNIEWDTKKLILDAWSMQRPVVPAPWQISSAMYKYIFLTAVTSKKSLLYHSWITFSSAITGFFIGAFIGILIAVCTIYKKTLQHCLLPWIVASQAIPILAIAPMIIVVLGSIGIVGLLPKALISTYLSFFPITIGMVKGLTTSDKIYLELAKSYNATEFFIFWKVRVPTSLPFFFASSKVAIAASVVGAIVGELPTGARAGLGARLLVGSYYGQTVNIWAALFTASLLAASLIFVINFIEKIVLLKFRDI